MTRARRLLLPLALLYAVAAARAQVTYVVTGAPALAECLERARDSTGAALRTCVEVLRSEGYLELSVDDVRVGADTIAVAAHQGRRYRLGDFRTSASASAEHGARRTDSLAAVSDLRALDEESADFLDRSARAGYPFARVRFDTLSLRDSLLDVAAEAWTGPLVTYGGVRFAEGVEPPVREAFLTRYLRLERGRRYRPAEIEQVSRRLRGLSYVELGREPVVVFENGEAFVYLDARARKTSRFDFLLGFLPNSEQNDGQLLLTGDATLELDNALQRGERLYFSFERLQPQSTEVELAASYPYLFDSPFGARVDFGLYRQQEDWLRVNYEAGLTYAFGGGDAYELFYEGGVAQALAFDTARVRATQRLPEVLDARRNGFGLRLRLDRRDDILDTRRGYRAVVTGVAGLREVTVASGIRELSERLATAADSIGGRTAQYRGEVDVAGYVPLGRRLVAVARARGGALFGSQTPLRNELYRIGGQRLLRGFDEQSIDAQTYVVGTVETRLLIGGGSYLFAFGDQGYLRNPYGVPFRCDWPTGFGAGLRLGTGAGALSLVYAYGKRRGAPVDFQRAKIHVGFESRF